MIAAANGNNVLKNDTLVLEGIVVAAFCGQVLALVLGAPFAVAHANDGITDEIAEYRRKSAYFVPIAQPKKKVNQPALDSEWENDELKENDNINYIRGRVGLWRDRGFADITPVSRALLDHWKDPERERLLYYCQIEALEVPAVPIYIQEKIHGAGAGSRLTPRASPWPWPAPA